MREFTFGVFSEIIDNFCAAGYQVLPFKDYAVGEIKSGKYLILRHDVDRFPLQALKMARIESNMGILGTYFFRIIPSVFKPAIIEEIASLGHEIGYHYEDLSTCHGNIQKAIASFSKNLDLLRDYYPVMTICMHGSPYSRWDNKLMWNKNEYRQYGIVADVYLDVDFEKVFYITDNGNGWNKTNVSIRDKVKSSFHIPIRNTGHLISMINSSKLPDLVMLNAHPNSFFDFGTRYIINRIFTGIKNRVK